MTTNVELEGILKEAGVMFCDSTLKHTQVGEHKVVRGH